MNMAKHTGLPYEARELATDKMFPTTTILGKSKRGDPMVVCRVDLRDDAAFIVRACNSYADLLAACKQFAAYADSGKHPRFKSYLDTIAGAKMRAAIAKAEGGAA